MGQINCVSCDSPARILSAGPIPPARTTLGIASRDGSFANYTTLPIVSIPDHVSDDKAISVEPLAAAC